jgi:hypothetical protein
MNITNSQTTSTEFESDAEAESGKDLSCPPPTTIGRYGRRRLGDQFRPSIGYPQFQSAPEELSGSSPSPNKVTGPSEDISEISEDSYVETTAIIAGVALPLRIGSASIQSITSTTSDTSTIKQESTDSDIKGSWPPSLDNQEPIIISADTLEGVLNGTTQVFHYPGPRNPLSRHMRFPTEEPLSSNSELDEDGNPEDEEVIWTDEWWAQIGHINGGYRGRNHVKERGREHGVDKKG